MDYRVLGHFWRMAHGKLPSANGKKQARAVLENVLDRVQPTPAAPPSDGPTQPHFDYLRRRLVKATLATAFAGLALNVRRAFSKEDPKRHGIPVAENAPIDFIVVGSGAGGGPVACNLAKAGYKVVLLEAGGDEADDVASVPFFSAATIEDPRVRWDYYVRHYTNDEQQQRDTKYIAEKGGVWYPRVGALGGCTLHSFMVAIYPSDSDWDHIAKITGDRTWNARRMRRYFQRLEQCRYVRRPHDGNPARHGFDGWQPTELPDGGVYAGDPKVFRILREVAQEIGDRAFSLLKFFLGALDPNDWRIRNDRERLFNIPLFTDNGQRFGTRQLVRETRAALPNNLIVKTHCLVTRVLLEAERAIGVEYIEGRHLYRADPNASSSSGSRQRKTIRASREVILSAGAFNTPQILKLSGIGPREELERFNIKQVVDLPGVGENLQDRYEIGVVTDMKSDWTYADGCRPGHVPDPCFNEWLQGKGPYTGYGVPAAFFQKSNTARLAQRPDPDLYTFVALTRFKGYYPGFSQQDLGAPDAIHQLTWVVLKAHTLNRAGTVKLRSSDPRDTPVINFHYFDEGSDDKLEDLYSVVDGIELARRLNTRIAGISNGEIYPGPEVRSREDIADFVRDQAWSHHASCTCKIGPASDPMAVVDSNFLVHGTRNLRVVDASVFPRIPGYFIITPIYMISEKASDVILRTAAHDWQADPSERTSANAPTL